VTGEEARRRFERERVARLATVRAGGTHVVPICFAVEGDLVYWAVDEKPKRTRRLQRLENIRANPHVSVLADHYDEDWTKLWWVRADGVARVVHDHEQEARALELLRAKYAQYEQASPAGPVVEIVVERWSGWTAA
jgi:PPOX class probable F420-dependent enzyme